MAVKVTIPNTSSDSVVFGSANTTTAAEVVGIDSGSTNGQLAFKTTASGTSTERMRIDSSGNVGIGTSSPNAKLEVNGQRIRINNASDPGLELSASSVVKGYVFYDTTNNVVTVRHASSISGINIDSSGNVLINTASAFASGKMAVLFNGATNQGINMKTTYSGNGSGYIDFYNSSGSSIGNINQATGSTVAYATSSDYRLKENIAPMVGALEKVLQLNPVTYTWKQTGEDGQGFIAHELQAVVPDCVIGEKDAVHEDGSIKPQGIDTSFLVATLTAAIQEQQELIKQLQADVAALKGAK